MLLADQLVQFFEFQLFLAFFCIQKKCHLLAEHVEKHFVDRGWADAYERAGGRYYPKLQVSVPFTPATGPRLLTGGNAPAKARSPSPSRPFPSGSITSVIRASKC